METSDLIGSQAQVFKPETVVKQRNVQDVVALMWRAEQVALTSGAVLTTWEGHKYVYKSEI